MEYKGRKRLQLEESFEQKRRVEAPESFDRLEHEINPTAYGVQQTNKQEESKQNKDDEGDQNFQASASFPLTTYIETTTEEKDINDQDYSDGKLGIRHHKYPSFHKAAAMALPAQVHSNLRASYDGYGTVPQPNSSGAFRSSDLIAAGADSIKSPWLSVHKSSNMPKSSFCSMSLSASSQNPISKLNRKGSRQASYQNMDEYNENVEVSQVTREECSQARLSEAVSKAEQEESLQQQAYCPSLQMIEPDELPHPLICASEQDGQSSEPYANDDEVMSGLSRGGRMCANDDVGKHLLGSLHLDNGKEDGVTNWHIREEDDLLRGLKSQAEYYYRIGDAAEDSSMNEKSQECTSRNSMKIAAIRSIMEEHHSKTQQQPERRTLKRTTTVEKPSNSPMLLASAASISASSPASGGQTSSVVDRLTERQLKGTNQPESLESMSGHMKRLNPMTGSSSTVEILQRDQNRLQPIRNSQASNQSERNLHQLKKDNTTDADSSLVLSASGATSSHLGTQRNGVMVSGSNTMPHAIHQRNSFGIAATAREPYSGKNQMQMMIDGGFYSTAMKALQGHGGGSDKLLRKKSQAAITNEGTSQVSGHGSLLHQFITEGMDDEDDEESKVTEQKMHQCGVFVNRLDCESEASSLHQGYPSTTLTARKPLLDKQLLSGSNSLKNVVDAGSDELCSNSSNFTAGKMSSVVMLPKPEDTDDQVGVLIDNTTTRSNDAELLLEAIKSGRPSVTPDPTNMFIDDEIQRVVSQVRLMDKESGGDDTNHINYKFEIERTDSLEFTRNSGTGIDDENDEDDVNDEHTEHKISDLTQNEVEHSQSDDNQVVEEDMDDIKKTLCGEEKYPETTRPSHSEHNKHKRQHHGIFQSELSLTSEHVVQNDTTSFEEPPEQDMNERSATSSMYRADEQGEFNNNYQLQDDSQTATVFRGIHTATDSRFTTTGYMPIPTVYEIPHASSKVFDEGDMPIPAKFRRKNNKSLKKTNEVIDETAEILMMNKSRVKDHVNRFIRESQEIGTSLGLIKEQQQDSMEHQSVIQTPKQKNAGCKSHKQSFYMQPKHLISPQKNQSDIYNISPTKQSQLDFLSAINHAGQTNHPGSVFSNDLPEAYNMMMAHSAFQPFKQSMKSGGIITYKDSHFHQEAAKGGGLPQEQSKMRYEDLLGLDDIGNSEAYYQNMPQQSISIVPEQFSSSQAYLKFSQEQQQLKMQVGSTFEYVKEEFKRRDYFEQLQSMPSDQTTDSENFGQFPQSHTHQQQPVRLGLAKTENESSNEDISSYRDSEENRLRPGPWHPRNIDRYAMNAQNCKVLDQSLDQSLAEYDCADEAMDGPDSVCLDDLILAQNRDRVQQMNIQKPTILKNNEIEPVKVETIKEENMAPRKSTSTLKNLLFYTRDQPPSNKIGGSLLQLPATNSAASALRSASSKTKKAFSFAESTYLRNEEASLTARNNLKPIMTKTPPSLSHHESCTMQDLSLNTKKKQAPQLTQQKSPTQVKYSFTEASSLSDYQISQQLRTIRSPPNQAEKYEAQYGTTAIPMSTIMESAISIDNQHQPHKVITDQSREFIASNRNIWPCSSTKKEFNNKSRMVYDDQPHQYLTQTAQTKRRANCDALSSQQLHNYNATAHRPRQNCTVLSLNSSRQPTTKNQLEQQFLQGSHSNDGESSTSTRKPEMIISQFKEEDMNDETTQKRFAERQTELQFKGGRGCARGGEPMTGQDDDIECLVVGRGLAESQYFSLDSAMEQFLYTQGTQQQLPQHQLQGLQQPDETISWMGARYFESKEAPTLQQTNSMMFRTENNLLLNSDHVSNIHPSHKYYNHHNQNQLHDGSHFTAVPKSTTVKKNRTSQMTNLTAQSSLMIPGQSNYRERNFGASDQQSVGTNCHNCVVEKRKNQQFKRSQTHTAFQDAIKMTQYLMKEIEKLSQTNKETAGLVVTEQQMTQMLLENYNQNQEFDEEEKL